MTVKMNKGGVKSQGDSCEHKQRRSDLEEPKDQHLEHAKERRVDLEEHDSHEQWKHSERKRPDELARLDRNGFACQVLDGDWYSMDSR
jgi:hypothetical protein